MKPEASEYYGYLGHIHPYAHVFDLSGVGIDFLLNGMFAGQG